MVFSIGYVSVTVLLNEHVCANSISRHQLGLRQIYLTRAGVNPHLDRADSILRESNQTLHVCFEGLRK